MKYKINYGSRVAVIPENAINALDRAGETDLKVLISLCSLGGSADVKKLAKLASCGEDDVREALSFWRGTGVIEPSGGKDSASGETLTEDKSAAAAIEGDQADKTDRGANKTDKTEKGADKTDKRDKSDKSETAPSKKLRGSDELPRYTSDELAEILEQRRETASLIDECQRIMGKVFNLKEINVLMGLVDYLELDCEYIMMLLTYCVASGKKTLHYAEKLAFALYDEGITKGEQLAEELRRREAASSAEGKIRAMFGVGERAFTTKEKKFISAWINDLGYSEEIIEKAYEVTADATGKGSFAYANSVLERWYAAGLRTLSEIEESYKKGEGTNKPSEGSFDTDSFFEAAVRRSLGE